jgi:hypothetical protein
VTRWFQRRRQPDIWEHIETRPLGDIEAAQQIREICRSAASIVDRMARGWHHAEMDKATRTERYQAAIKRALEIAMNISDDAMRDVAVTQIIALCVRVDHMKTARTLIRAIKSDSTRSELIADNPALTN